ncbi:MAG: hypothetical protein HRT90_09940 [Candidatus Margulisbacteria bacterium]|nr:hypothetical protein [Candidatus Margulisiibacteriota bacterium]
MDYKVGRKYDDRRQEISTEYGNDAGSQTGENVGDEKVDSIVFLEKVQKLDFSETNWEVANTKGMEERIDWKGMVVQNPKVRSNLEALNANIIDQTGKKDEDFVIEVTGGDRYRDSKNLNIIRSKSDNKPIPNSAQNSQHLVENKSSAVDVKYTGIKKKEFLKAKSKTRFTGFYKDDYEDKHSHLSLPRKNILVENK